MAKVFYDHLINISEVIAELDKSKLKHDEKVELIRIVDTTIHYQVMETILSHTPKEKQASFLKEFKKLPSDKKHLRYLKEHKEDIEQRILEAIIKVKKEIVADLKQNK